VTGQIRSRLSENFNLKAKKFKDPERENARLRKLVAEVSLEKAMLKEPASQNW